MTRPDWLSVGASVRAPDGVEWEIHSVGARRVELQHPEHGRHRVLRADLLEWVEDGEWAVP